MSVYVDQITRYPSAALHGAQTRRNGRNWSHLWGDTDEELQDFADELGLKRAWFQRQGRYPHYDIVPSKRRQAIKMGAIETTTKEYIRNHEPSSRA